MQSLSTYICEGFRLRDDTKISKHDKRLCDMLYNELSKDKYRLTFKIQCNPKSKRADMDNFIHEIPEEEIKYYKSELFECFKKVKEKYDCKIFKMSVWDNGNLNFHETPGYGQGVIVRHSNNTSFKYFILVNNDNHCYLCGFQRGNYGMTDVAGKIYEFDI